MPGPYRTGRSQLGTWLAVEEMSDYYRHMHVPDVDRVSADVRPMTRDDGPAFARFMERVSEGEQRFLKESHAEAAAALDTDLRPDARVRRLVAVESNGEVVGVAGAFPGSGWSSHVAELRVLVATDRRRRGIGRDLARGALVEALNLGCRQAYVEVVAEQESLVAMFQDLGFEPAALLPDFVRDSAGEFHDLMLLTHRTDEQWGIHHLLGLEGLDR